MHRAKFPTDPDILARLGSYYYTRGFVKKAIEATEEAKRYEYRLNSYYSQARRVNIASNLVPMYLAMGNLSAASREAHRAVALDPEEPFALRSLATVQMNQREYSAARNTWRKFIAVRPEDLDAWFGLREICRLMGDSLGMALADARLKQLENEAAKKSSRPLQISEKYKVYVIFGLTVTSLLLVFLARASSTKVGDKPF
jgi:tetratricopeptide (TPR) repeat protein